MRLWLLQKIWHQFGCWRLGAWGTEVCERLGYQRLGIGWLAQWPIDDRDELEAKRRAGNLRKQGHLLGGRR